MTLSLGNDGGARLDPANVRVIGVKIVSGRSSLTNAFGGTEPAVLEIDTVTAE